MLVMMLEIGTMAVGRLGCSEEFGYLVRTVQLRLHRPESIDASVSFS